LAVGKENATDGNYAGYLGLYTRANGGSTTERARIDSSGNLGLGVTPSSWATVKAYQVGRASIYGYSGTDSGFQHNAYYNAGWNYIATDYASQYVQQTGGHVWKTAPSGTAGTAITFTQAMTLNNSGALGFNLSGSISYGTSGQVLTSGGSSAAPTWTTPTTGTVTSVTATVPSFLSISGSPITTSGTLAISYSGTALPIANGGTGITSTPSNGQLLIGNGTGYTAATLTAGSNITITNSSGGITIASSGGGGGTLVFPFYKADGTSDTISLVSGTALPFFNSSGTAKNIALTT
jgi:hypothetical protein